MELESTVEKDKMDLGLARFRFHRRCTKSETPIRAQMATAPPMAPAIAAVFCFFRDDGGFFVVAPDPLVYIVCGRILREGS
jgi:hypothetical protein